MSSGDWSGEVGARAAVPGRTGEVAILAAAALLGLFAYRDLIALDLPTDLVALESWFIRPTGLPFPLALAGALWLLWRRRWRWQALPRPAGGGWLAAAALAASAALLAWARLTGVVDLLVQSLAALGVGLAALQRGRAGARLLALPAVFLLLALSPSPAAVNEIFWWIQVHTAAVAAAVVDGFGRPILLETIILTTPSATFAVIESCASLGVLMILVALAMLLRERVATLGARSWLLVLGAIPLAILLNLLRVVTIVMRPEINEWSHLIQWGVLIGCGALVLGSVARVLERRVPEGSPPLRAGAGLSRAVLPALAVLALLSLLTRIPPPPLPAEPSARAIPLEQEGWRAEEGWVDAGFLGWVRFRDTVARFYRREDELVHLFVGIDDARARTASPFSSKTLLPGFGWVEMREAESRPVGEVPPPETAIVGYETERWWVAQWRLGDRGVLGETLRHAFAVDSSPFAEPRIRAVVRLSVPLPDPEPGPEALEAAAASARDFLADFGAFLPLPPHHAPAPRPDAR